MYAPGESPRETGWRSPEPTHGSVTRERSIMSTINVMQARLSLFGGAEAGTGGPAPSQAPEAAAPETDAGEEAAAPGEGTPADEAVPDAGGQESEKDRKKAFMELVNGPFKDLYTAQTQKIIDRRFRQSKQMEERLAKLEPVAQLLFERYGIEDGDADRLLGAVESDARYWEEAARKEGLSVPRYMQLRKLQRENEKLERAVRLAEGQRRADAQMERWEREAARAAEEYPGFDLAEEARDPRFLALLKSGVPVDHAYRVIHLDELMSGAVERAERRVVESVRARGARPEENGTAAQAAFTVREDVSKLSRKDRAEIARAVARGERVSF